MTVSYRRTAQTYVKIGERIYSLQKENKYLKECASQFTSQIPILQKKLDACQAELLEEREKASKLKEECNSLLKKLNVSQSNVENRNFAQENFSRVKYERDMFYNEILDLKKRIESMRMESLQAQQEKENLKEELIDTKQSLAVLRKECENISSQLSDTVQKWGEFQDKASHLQSELKMERLSREELLHRFANSRDKLRENFDERLDLERSKMKSEMIQLHEKEIRSLSESKLTAIRQKETAESAMVELRIKYEQLYAEFHETSAHDTAEIRKLKKELEQTKAECQKKSSEIDNIKYSNEAKHLEYNKAVVKLQIIEKELESLKQSSEEKINRLENELAANKAQLEIYEELEKELNEVIFEAAQVEDPSSDIFDKVSSGIPMAANARFTFTRCVNLTKKNLELERTVSSLRKELETETAKQIKADEELTKANKLLQQVRQPYAYMISTIKSNESYIAELKEEINELKRRIIAVMKERDDIQAEKDQIVSDLQQSWANREELIRIKQELEVLKRGSTQTSKIGITHPSKPLASKRKTFTKRK